jgi:hypothetical protein
MRHLAAAAAVLLVCSTTAWGGIHYLPSPTSTVTATVPTVDSTQLGWFFSAALHHEVREFFTDLETVSGLARLRLDVPSNTLTSQPVSWEVLINNVEVGTFDVAPGYVGPISVDFAYPLIAAQNGGYTVALEVTSNADWGTGGHTLAYAGSLDHTITILPEPATLGLLGAGLALGLARRRRVL